MQEKISIGTAQWGLDYGINNKKGKLENLEIVKIFEFAKEKGINTIDTAFLYGNCESILGQFDLSEIDIVTKTIKFTSNTISNEDINHLENCFYKSLNNLNCESIYSLLIHDGNDLLKYNGKKIINKLNDFKEKNLVQKIGVSIYSLEELNSIINIYRPDIVQLPLNVFSQSFLKSGAIKKLKDRDIEIHVRSIFLQGILLMNTKDIPNYFSPWINQFKKWENFCNSNNLTKLEASLNFVFSIEMIDKIIIGFDNIDQFIYCLKNLKLRKNLNYESLNINNPNLTNPSLWKL